MPTAHDLARAADCQKLGMSRCVACCFSVIMRACDYLAVLDNYRADGNFAFKTFSGSLFHLFANEVQVTILYESGAEYKATFPLYVEGVSE